jgi:hypothetical protein
VGQFEKNKLCGVAEVWRSSENVYRGQCVNGYPHGWGHQKLEGEEWMGKFNRGELEDAILHVCEKGNKKEVQYWRDKTILSSSAGLLASSSTLM